MLHWLGLLVVAVLRVLGEDVGNFLLVVHAVWAREFKYYY
jgi:hypothetical protein